MDPILNIITSYALHALRINYFEMLRATVGMLWATLEMLCAFVGMLWATFEMLQGTFEMPWVTFEMCWVTLETFPVLKLYL